MTTLSRFILHQLEFFVFLGHDQAERTQRQRIAVDIHIDFVKPPIACVTDQLTDTVCYDTLNQTIMKHITSKEFRLLEHLAYEIYSCVKTFLSLDSRVRIGVTKFPDVFLTSSGISFWYGDDQCINIDNKTVNSLE
jgi:FolB domain-containing protein